MKCALLRPRAYYLVPTVDSAPDACSSLYHFRCGTAREEGHAYRSRDRQIDRSTDPDRQIDRSTDRSVIQINTQTDQSMNRYIEIWLMESMVSCVLTSVPVPRGALRVARCAWLDPTSTAALAQEPRQQQGVGVVAQCPRDQVAASLPMKTGNTFTVSELARVSARNMAVDIHVSAFEIIFMHYANTLLKGVAWLYGLSQGTRLQKVPEVPSTTGTQSYLCHIAKGSPRT